MNLQYDRPVLYPKQFEAVFDPRRYSLIEASTKSGKTAGCIVWLVERAMKGRAGMNFWWVAPVSIQANIAFDRARRALPRDMYAISIQNKSMTLLNGAVIWFKSADHPDTLYGEDVHAAVVDEASRMKETAWHAIRSTLTATQGPVRIIGNVKGRSNWFYEMARKAQQGEDPAMGYHRIVAHDAIEAGVLSEEEIEDARRHYPEHIFKELYLAEASDDQGNPFGVEAIRKCVSPGLSKEKPIVWGWDLAKSQDWTVGIGLDKHGKVCRFERWQGPWERTVDLILKHTGSTHALVDSTGVGDPIIERLQKKPLTKYEGYHFTQTSKQKLMEGLAVAIQSGEVSYPEGRIVLELEAFEYDIRPTGGVRYSAREGMHDDCVCALALAVMHWSRKRALAAYSSMEWVK